jgi:hypothetical protein
VDSTAIIQQQFVDVILDDPVVIDSTQELWIGIRCVTTAGYPLGSSNNGGVFNYGDLLYYEEDDGTYVWVTLSGGNPSSSLAAYNWCINGKFVDLDAPTLTGYNLTRDADPLLSTSTLTSYLDSVDFGTYEYAVTALWSDGCESDPVTLSVTMTPNPCLNCSDTVQVGNGTGTTYYIPLNGYYKYSFSEQLFTTSELGTIDGTIPCIAFQYFYATPQDKDIIIYMGNTSKNSFANSSDWISINSMTKVFEGTVTFTNAGEGNWVNIPLDIPFEYDGSSNIVIAVQHTTGSYLNNDYLFKTHSASGKTLYVYRDSEAYDVNNLPSGNTLSSRNNIRFFIGDPVACPMPSAVTVSNVTPYGATVTWSSNDEQSGYEYVIVPEGSTFESETIETVSDTTITFTELADGTNYTFYLRANCGSDNSNWASVSFKTLCLPSSTLPYTMNFDGMGSGTGTLPNCWEAGVAGSNNGYPYISTTYHHSGNGALYFYSYSPSSSSVCGQGLDLTENTESLLMSFWMYKTSAGYGRMLAGYMTDPYDFSTFVEVLDLYPQDSPTSAWKEYKFPLPDNVNGQLIYPVLYCPHAPGSYSDYIYVDDLTIEVGDAECLAAADITVSNVSYTSAYVTFTPTVEDLDHILVCTNQATGVSSQITLTPGTTDYMLTGLDTTTQYQVKLYPDCESIPDTIYASFTTLMGSIVYCMDPDTNAQAISVGTSSTSYNIPLNNFYKYTYSQQIFTPSEIGGATVITGMSLNYAGPNSSTVKNNVSVYLTHKNDSTFANTSDWAPIANAVKVYEGPMNCSAGWNDFQFTTFFPYNGISNLVLIVDDNSGAYDGSSSYSFNVHTKASSQYTTMYVYSDGTNYDPTNPPSGSRYAIRNDIKFFGCNQTQSEVISCREPNVMVTGYDSTEITLSWVPGGEETSWTVEYKEANSNDWVSAGTVSSVTTYTVENLMPNTHYDFRMCSLCSASDSSEWVEFTGFTVCESINVPYVENFETATGSGATHTVPCWFKGTDNSTQYPYPSSTYYNSGTYSLYFYGTSTYYCYAATPKFADDVAMDSLVVNIKLLATSAAYTIEVGIMSDPMNINTFVPLASCTPGVEGLWKNFEILTTGYAGNGRHLAFRIPQWGSSYMYLDDLSVDYIMPCAHPTAVVLQDVSSEEATIGWTPGDEESEWEYLYGPAGTVDLNNDMGISSTNEYVTISGLTDNTEYEFYVRAVCSSSENSAWESLFFQTECQPIALLPYTQNFDSMSTHTSNSTSGLNNLSDCWKAHNDGTSYTSYPYVYYGSTYANSGNYSLRFYSYNSSAYSDQYAILPAVDNDLYPINTLQLTFDARRYSTSYPFCLIVGAMNGTDVSTFQPIDTMLINTGSTSYETQVVFLTGYTGSGNRLALMAPVEIGSIVSGATYNQGHIDNVTISLAPTCPQPTHLSATNVTDNSVTLEWTENGSANNWVIEYGPAGFTPGNGTEVQANTNPFTISNLAAATIYNFYVKADCGSGDESTLSGPVAATPGSYSMSATGTNTVTTCAMVIYDDGGIDNDYSTSCNSTLIIQPDVPGNLISISGTVNVESNWDYLYVYDGASSSDPLLGTYSGSYTITDLTSTTGPLTLVFTSDASVVYPGFELVVSCVSNSCPKPTNFAVSNVGMNTADLSWTPGGSETAWIVEYKEATAATWTTATATATNYQLTGLSSLTAYNVRVKADCGDETSQYATASFTTPNCPAADACEYTFVLTDSYGDGWNSAYLTVEQNGTVIATLEAVDYDLSSTPTHDTVTVNLCDNNVIDLVWHSGSFDSEASITLIGPDGSQIYTSPSMSSYTTYSFTTDCNGSGPGPVITDPTVATNAASAIEQTTATLSATITNPDNVSITAKGFEWKATTGGTYTQIAGTGTGNTFTANLTGLTPNTGYTYKAFITFNGQTVYGNEMTFTTLEQGVEPCDVPTGLAAGDITGESIAISWNASANAEGYNIQYSPQGGTISSATSTTNNYTITGLAQNTTYQIQVQANCGNGNLSGWSEPITVTTPGIENYLSNSITLYPNPANDVVNVQCTMNNVQLKGIEVIDVYGKVVRTVVGANNYSPMQTRINVSDLAAGMYFVRVTTDEGTVTKTFVKK